MRQLSRFYRGTDYEYYQNETYIFHSNQFLIFFSLSLHFLVASTEDSPIANKLKRIWFKTPIGEEQATQAVLDPVVGKSLSE